MNKKSRFFKVMIVLILTIAMMPTQLNLYAKGDNTNSGGIIDTDSTNFDVFMNVDPSYGDSEVLQGKVENYLNKLIQQNGSSEEARFYSTSTNVDPTDLTKWNVYDHYDTTWYANKTEWQNNYKGRGDVTIPETWYYYGMKDGSVTSNKNQNRNIKTNYADTGKVPVNGQLTIQDIFEGNGTNGYTAFLREHIRTYTDDTTGTPAMQFYGYGTSNWADFLYYPASATSTKKVDFDVDASNVLPHSLKYTGFLVNTTVDGTPGTGSALINGYLILFQYSGDSTASSLSGVYLYKLTDVNVDKLHNEGLKGVSGATQVAKATKPPFYKNSHISLEITGTSLKATMQDNASSTGNVTTLFDLDNLIDTKAGGFGPYVDYGVTGHTCEKTSSFLYSNLKMSFSEPVGTGSALAAYQYADYLKQSDQKFFINLTDKNKETSSYGTTASDMDKGYLTLIEKDKTILLTDEGVQDKSVIYPEMYLNNNTKNVYHDSAPGKDVTMEDIRSIYDGSDSDEILTAKLAWLIYHSKWDDTGVIDPQTQNVIVADVKLMNDKVGSSSGVQVSNIKRELIGNSTLKVYPDPTKSVNVNPTTDTPEYTLTYPDGKTEVLLNLDNDGAFGIENNNSDWPIGNYNLNLKYKTTDTSKQMIESNTTFTVTSDTVAPITKDVTINRSSATFTFENTASTTDFSYTAPLDAYGYVVNKSSIRPGEPTYTQFPDTSNPVINNVDLGNNLTVGDNYYVHTFVKDQAGNLSWKATKFTVTTPTLGFIESSAGSATVQNPYQDESVTIEVKTEGTYNVAKIEVSTDGTTWVEVDKDEDGNYPCALPAGEYILQVRGTDTASNITGKLNLPVNAKMYQVLTGKKIYNLELGVDITNTFDLVATDKVVSNPTGANISYVDKTSSNGVVTLNGTKFTINKTGNAIIEVTAAGTNSYREAKDEIIVNVKNPLTIKLNATIDTIKNGVTVDPSYVEGFYGIDNAKLKIREKGKDWQILGDWTLGNEYTISYDDLKDYVDYEVVVEAQDQRANNPYVATSTIFSFKTPDILPQITSSDVKDGITGNIYNDKIEGTGTAPLTFEVVAGKMPDGLTLNSLTGEIAGTPTVGGDYTFTVELSNGAGNKTTQEYTIRIDNPPMIITDRIANAIRGNNYNEQLVATGDGIMTWSVSQGKLPTGLVLDKGTGKISGKPTESGTYQFTITVESKFGKDTKVYNVYVAAPPVITTTNLPDSIEGKEYNEMIKATGDSSIEWSITSGKLPHGLTLDSISGKIIGIITKSGTYKFELTATNPYGSDTKEYTINVAKPAKITTETIDNTIKGNDYKQKLAATGDGQINWSIASGKLPEGIILNQETGILEGIAKEHGTFEFTIIATNEFGEDSKEYSLFVGNPPTIDEDTTLPEAKPGEDFDFSIDVDGDKPLHWQVVEGQMPPGLELDEDTGHITGKPTKPGDYTFVVEVTNPSGSQRKQITIFVPYPPVIIEQPANQVVNDQETVKFKIDVDGTKPFTFQWQVNKGNGWEDIDGETSKEYSFVASLNDNNNKYRCVVTNKVETIISDEATLEVKEIIKPSPNITTPTTGDNTNFVLELGLMTLGCLGIVALVQYKRKKD